MLPRKGRKANATSSATQLPRIEPQQEPTIRFIFLLSNAEKDLNLLSFHGQNATETRCLSSKRRKDAAGT